MKLILLALFFLAACLTSAQNSSYNYNYDWNMQNLNRDAITDDQKGEVSEIKIEYIGSKEKYNRTYEKTFNEEGLVTLYKTTFPSKGEQAITLAEYNDAGKMTHYRSSDSNGKLRTENFNTYDGEERLIEYKTLDKKGNIKRKSIWNFGDNGGKCATTSTYFKKGGEKIYRIWNYEFYSACDNKKTTLSNAKGKTLKTWSFDCKKEGEQLSKKKDETQICKWDESDGKYLTKTYQNFDDKGRITKSIQKYTLKDTLIVESSYYDSKDRLTWKATYDESFDRQSSWTSYNNKGEVIYSTIKVYEKHKIMSSSYTKKGKLRSESKYHYNDKGWLNKIEKFNEKGALTSTSNYEYVAK